MRGGFKLYTKRLLFGQNHQLLSARKGLDIVAKAMQIHDMPHCLSVVFESL